MSLKGYLRTGLTRRPVRQMFDPDIQTLYDQQFCHGGLAADPELRELREGELWVNTSEGKLKARVGGVVVTLSTLSGGGSPSVAWADITGRPTTLAGYGISDAYTRAETDALLGGKSSVGHTHGWAEVSKVGSSLADLAVRSAADLASGNLDYNRLPLGAGTWTLNGQLTLASGNLLVSRATNGALSALAENGSAGASALARMGVQTGVANQGVTFEVHGSGYTPSGARRPLWGMLNAQSQLSGLVLATQKVGATIEVYTGGLTAAELRGVWSSSGLQLSGSLLPGSSAAYDLGAAGTRWRHGWLSGDLAVGGALAVAGASRFAGAVDTTGGAASVGMFGTAPGFYLRSGVLDGWSVYASDSLYFESDGGVFLQLSAAGDFQGINSVSAATISTGAFGLSATPQAQKAAIAAPAGGVTQDAEARAAIVSILAVLSEASGGFGFTA